MAAAGDAILPAKTPRPCPKEPRNSRTKRCRADHHRLAGPASGASGARQSMVIRPTPCRLGVSGHFRTWTWRFRRKDGVPRRRHEYIQQCATCDKEAEKKPRDAPKTHRQTPASEASHWACLHAMSECGTNDAQHWLSLGARRAGILGACRAVVLSARRRGT